MLVRSCNVGLAVLRTVVFLVILATICVQLCARRRILTRRTTVACLCSGTARATLSALTVGRTSRIHVR